MIVGIELGCCRFVVVGLKSNLFVLLFLLTHGRSCCGRRQGTTRVACGVQEDVLCVWFLALLFVYGFLNLF